MTKIISILNRIKEFALRHKFLTAGILIVLALIAFFVFRPAPPVSFEYMTVEATTLKTSVEGSGSVSTESQVTLRSTVSGRITAVLVRSGEEVRQGQPLVRIDGTAANQSLQRANLALEQAQLALARQQASTLVQGTRADNMLTTRDANLTDAYTEGRTLLSAASTAMADVVAALEPLFNCNTGYLTTCRGYSSSNQAQLRIRNAESRWWDAHNILRDEFQDKYRTISQDSSREDIEAALDIAREAATIVADAARLTQDAVVYSRDRVDWSDTYGKERADVAYAVVTVQVPNANQTLASVNTARNAIINGKQALQEAGVDVADIGSGSNALDARSQELTLRERQLAVDDARIELAKYTITAPFAGTVGSVAAIQHDWLGSNAAVATLSTDKRTAQISLNEVDVTHISIGQKAELTFDALPDVILTGTVSEIDSVGIETSNVVSFKVKITFEEEDARVRPGMGVTANIITSEKENVLTVPNGAIRTENGSSYVEVRNATTGNNDRVEVTLGTSNDVETEILSGLSGGEEVMVRQLNGASPRPSGGFGPGGF